MAILWTLIGILSLCLMMVLTAWGILVLARRSALAPTIPSTSQDVSNKIKGRQGEIAVTQRLLRELPSAEYQLFSNVVVPGANGSRKTEIDHVIVSRFGVFAIETKTWPGLIFPTNDRELWTQKVGRAINMHSSPVRQNERQVRALARHLDLRPNLIYGLVCFNGPNTRFADAIPPNVVLAERLTPSILRRQKVVLNDHGVAQAADSITALK